MQLYHTGRLSLMGVIEKLTVNPAKLLRFSDGRGSLKMGGIADITVLDPNRVWVRQREVTASKSRNDPFDGWLMHGQTRLTVMGGRVTWRAVD